MRAITIWQPYSGLIAIGGKAYETRSWNTSYRGPLAIHAAAKDPRTLLHKGYPFERYISNECLLGPIDKLPRGAIIAVVDLVDVWSIGLDGTTPFLESLDGKKRREITEMELAFGNYWPGQYAWEFANVRKLEKPIPAKGQQGFWNFKLEEDVQDALSLCSVR